MKTFITRSLTGIVYAGSIGLGIIGGPYFFLALFSMIVLLCLWEFYGLINTQRKGEINIYGHCFGGFLLFASVFFYVSGVFNCSVFFVYLAYIVATLISELYEKRKDPINHLAYIFFGQCYIALPVSVLNLVAFRNTGNYDWILVFALFVSIWMNDTGAYLIGVAFGKHRLFERISPKKSWEGFGGGLFFALISAFFFAHFRPEIPVYHWLGLSVAVVIFATWGDLIESLIKRTLEIKDSGRLLPGHGGFLDRFDSFLLAVYAVFFYIMVFID